MWGFLGMCPWKIYPIVLCDVFVMYVNGIMLNLITFSIEHLLNPFTLLHVHLNCSLKCLAMVSNPLFSFFLFQQWASSLPDSLPPQEVTHRTALYLSLYKAVWALPWNTDLRVALLAIGHTWPSAGFLFPRVATPAALPTGRGSHGAHILANTWHYLAF